MTHIIEAFRYAVVGLINTFSGLAIIFAFMELGAGDILAYFIGYACGFTISFFLNGKWTFKQSKISSPNTIKKFILIILAAYLLNLAAVILSKDYLNISSKLSQLCGVIAYTLASFFGMKFIAFRKSLISPHTGSRNHG
jgi:putative flippase GtrA